MITDCVLCEGHMYKSYGIGDVFVFVSHFVTTAGPVPLQKEESARNDTWCAGCRRVEKTI